MAWVTLVGGFLLAGYCGANKNEDTSKNILKARTFVQEHNPQKYNQILTNKNLSAKKWLDAAKEVSDSLRIDSIAKTNYALGMQAVRDSIKRAKIK